MFLELSGRRPDTNILTFCEQLLDTAQPLKPNREVENAVILILYLLGVHRKVTKGDENLRIS